MMLGFHNRGYYHGAYAFNQYLAAKGYAVLSVNYRSGIGYGLDFDQKYRNLPFIGYMVEWLGRRTARVAVLAVGAAGRQQAARAVDGAGVVPPVLDLGAYQPGVRLGDLRQGGHVGRGQLQVEVGVGGEVAGPGGVPGGQPEPGEPGRQHPARAE